jgi:hypothetical protein
MFQNILIQLNPNELVTASKQLFYPSIVFIIWYGIVFLQYYIYTRKYNIFLIENPNLLKPESKFDYWYQFSCAIYNFNTLGNSILFIVGQIQFWGSGKLVNVSCFFFLLLIDIYLSHNKWKSDEPIHKKNLCMFWVERSFQKIRIPSSQIMIGDMYFLERNVQNINPVPKAKLLDKIVIVDDTVISGEKRTKEETNYLYLDQMVLSSFPTKYLVEKVGEEMIQTTVDSNDVIPSLINKSTNLALLTITIITLVVYFFETKKKIIDISILLLISMRIFIGINQLFPTFKLTLGLKAFDFVYNKMCEKNGMEIKRHWHNK